MLVHTTSPHKHIPRGDPTMEYAETSVIGNTTIHIVEPPPMTDEQLDAIMANIHAAVYDILTESILP